MSTTVPVSILLILVVVFAAVVVLGPMMENIPEVDISAPDQMMVLSWDTNLVYDIELTTEVHATAKHGMEAGMARQCSDGRKRFDFFNEETKRTAHVCDLDGLWGIHILDEFGNEVTAFLKNKMKAFDQVLKYMRNSGYDLLH